MAGPTGSVGYNQNHIQVGILGGADEEWLDGSGAQAWSPAITADSTDIMGDGVNYVTAYGSPVGEGDFSLIDPTAALFAACNGGVVSSSGTGATAIERYEQPGTYVAPPFALSDWVPNIDRVHNPDTAGMRTTAPNCTAQPFTKSSGQETTVEWTAATKFTPDANDQLIIYEWLASEPIFTDGVMPVNIERPTP